MFSVVISTTGSPHLERIVHAFLASTQSVEIVIVIDNLAIGPEALLSASLRADPRVKIVVNDDSLGLTRSLNIGITAAHGDIILRCDDDDIPATHRLDETAAFFAAHPKVDIVYSYAEGLIKESGRKWTISGPQENAAIKAAILKRNFIVHSSLAFRRVSLQKIGFYDDTFRYAQDYDFYLRSIRAGLVFGCIPKILVTHIYHKNSITVAKRKRQILHSFAARILHMAQSADKLHPWPVLARYILLLIIPNWARDLRRKLGYGR